ncbi:MAG: hypothetical protein ACLR8P_03615 [Clostridium fessum]
MTLAIGTAANRADSCQAEGSGCMISKMKTGSPVRSTWYWTGIRTRSTPLSTPPSSADIMRKKDLM